MANEHETMTFDLSDEDLEYVIGVLKDRHPTIVYPVAWRIFTTERARRQEKGHPPPFPVSLSLSVYDELPVEVQRRLRPRRQPPPLTMKDETT